MRLEQIEQWARDAGGDWLGDIGASFIPKMCALAFAAGAEAMREAAAGSCEAQALRLRAAGIAEETAKELVHRAQIIRLLPIPEK